jgi:hypothetical protein
MRVELKQGGFHFAVADGTGQELLAGGIGRKGTSTDGPQVDEFEGGGVAPIQEGERHLAVGEPEGCDGIAEGIGRRGRVAVRKAGEIGGAFAGQAEAEPGELIADPRPGNETMPGEFDEPELNSAGEPSGIAGGDAGAKARDGGAALPLGAGDRGEKVRPLRGRGGAGAGGSTTNEVPGGGGRPRGRRRSLQGEVDVPAELDDLPATIEGQATRDGDDDGWRWRG